MFRVIRIFEITQSLLIFPYFHDYFHFFIYWSWKLVMIQDKKNLEQFKQRNLQERQIDFGSFYYFF
jgi:hypothetical protein